MSFSSRSSRVAGAPFMYFMIRQGEKKENSILKYPNPQVRKLSCFFFYELL
jgi:hypothetical protein